MLELVTTGCFFLVSRNQSVGIDRSASWYSFRNCEWPKSSVRRKKQSTRWTQSGDESGFVILNDR
ncbi:MAG: hypothetical protein CBE43_02615 [Rhodopirellula sp. TMED283]|nr:MAG: hypothetical protein CBE43_02615 [Rhodopirellula sp. TMED283]